MAYATSNPPYLIVAAVAGGFVGGSTATGGNVWAYRSTDPTGTVAGSSYFSNGDALRMRKFDVVLCLDTSTTQLGVGMVTAVTAAAGATVTFGTLTSSA